MFIYGKFTFFIKIFHSEQATYFKIISIFLSSTDRCNARVLKKIIFIFQKFYFLLYYEKCRAYNAHSYSLFLIAPVDGAFFTFSGCSAAEEWTTINLFLCTI